MTEKIDMEYTRLLKRYKSGDDVWAVKQRLLEMGYLSKATHNTYGNDTYRAVKQFQSERNLEADGAVGPLTWAELFSDEPVPEIDIPAHISESLATKLRHDIALVSEERRELCLLALQYATDSTAPDYPRGFYIRGANLFDQDLTLHEMSPSRLKAYFKREAYAPYYDNGRQDMMEKYAEEHGYNIPGADCSGMVVGLWRRRKIVKAGYDANANALYNSYCVKTDNPIPGDLCWKSGHIGLYVGAGYAVEAAGGAYGIQVVPCKKRKMWDFVKNKTVSQSGWTAYGDPKYY